MPAATAATAPPLCVKGGRVLAFDADDQVFDPGEVWIADGVIQAIGRGGRVAPPAGAAAARVIDASGRIVMPGLINGHCHSYASLLKGSVDVQPLDIYMLHVIAAGSGRGMGEVRLAALLDAIAMIRTGTTAVIDHFSHRPAMTDEAVEAAMQAYDEAGLRATIAPMFADLPYLETVPLAAEALPKDVRAAYARRGRPDPAAYFAVIEKALAALPRFGGRIGLLLGVDGPQRCSPALLEMTADFQKHHRLGLHTHMLETKTQAVMAKGGSFVRRMLDAGILDEKSSLVHFIWCSDDDIAAAREAGVTIVHSPVSNLMVGSGICPLVKLRSAGLAIAVGSDGFNCGVPNMFEKLRLACLLARVTEPEFENWPTARDILGMAYAGGARALGRPGRLGVLAEGAAADVIVVNPAAPLHRPMGAVWNHLVYYENGSGVETSIIDGRVVMAEGRITTLDEAAVLAEAEEAVARSRAGDPGAAAEIARQYPAFHDMVVETLGGRGGIERLMRIE